MPSSTSCCTAAIWPALRLRRSRAIDPDNSSCSSNDSGGDDDEVKMDDDSPDEPSLGSDETEDTGLDDCQLSDSPLHEDPPAEMDIVEVDVLASLDGDT